ncbi:right-handed parallel beta-helix repeat-containing protein [Sphingobacterium corticibacterium]|uniref:Right-handed parallel beta-helix repeat-containing protein n=1 Tax=Sphingobacterium corticibacterium TaxID=2484746 RepID=A0A4V2DBR3_9SPHI|nr:right-handed parallel beta-helix repeat-containing protein [Sphingobacterium corticibacterium]RZF58888.1 right-handed parallel beta-helix repeat-containing protein [Sphingobacterium corticibacterium]
MKILYVTIFVVWFSLGCAQDAERQHQPSAYNQNSINIEFDNYSDKASDLAKYLPSGYIKDGSIDYTRYLQQGIDENAIVSMPDFPVLINDRGLRLRSNSVILFNKNSSLKLIPSKKDTYNILEVHRIKNVKIFFPKIEGDILTHLGKAGEWGMGIGIRSSKNIQIYNPEITNCWGDGVYVGVIWDKVNGRIYDESESIGIYNGYFNNNGRNGISIVGVKGMKVYNNLIANTRRVFPKSGIDIEPGPKLTQEIVLMNNVTYKNGARGIDIFLRKIAKGKENTTSAKIINHKDIGSPIGIRIAGYKSNKRMNTVKGNIEVISPNLTGNRLKAIEIERDQRFAPIITIKDVKHVEGFDYTLKGVNSKKQIRVIQ